MSSVFLLKSRGIGTDSFPECWFEMVLIPALGYDQPDRCGCTANYVSLGKKRKRKKRELLLGKSDAQEGRLSL